MSIVIGLADLIHDLRVTDSCIRRHGQGGFTLRTYAHATRQMQEQAAEKMGNFMAQLR